MGPIVDTMAKVKNHPKRRELEFGGEWGVTMLLRVFLLTSAVVVAASQSAFGVSQIGAGTMRCGEWTHLRPFRDKQAGHVKEVTTLNQVQAWIDGFV